MVLVVKAELLLVLSVVRCSCFRNKQRTPALLSLVVSSRYHYSKAGTRELATCMHDDDGALHQEEWG